jgi:predicted nucleic acid-binding protein
MIFVIDASVAIKWFVDEPDRAYARFWLDSSCTLVAPDLLRVEVANIAWKKQTRGEMTSDQAAETLAALEDVFDWFEPADRHLSSALEMACELSHPVYDCLYLACADALATSVVTADRRLAAAAAKSGKSHLTRSVETRPEATSLSMLRTALSLPMTDIEDLERLAVVVGDITSGMPVARLRSANDFARIETFARGSPAFRRLSDMVENLSAQDRLTLLVAIQLGLVPGQPLDKAVNNANAILANPNTDITRYLSRYVTVIRAGLATLAGELIARPPEE